MFMQCRNSYHFLKMPFIFMLIVFVTGCAANSQVGKQAGRGGAMGAVGGAVAGAVGSLLWGGNVLAGAIKGGITGAAAGAATGAVSGAIADSESQASEPRQTKEMATRQKELAELESKIGKRNYEAALLLADCKHPQAIDAAKQAYLEAKDAPQRTYALLLQAVAAEEMGDKNSAASLYPKIVQEDPQHGSIDKARSDALEGVLKIQRLRQDHGMSPICSH